MTGQRESGGTTNLRAEDRYGKRTETQCVARVERETRAHAAQTCTLGVEGTFLCF